MPEALQKKYGPFKGWQWLLIAAVGIGLGLLIRSRLKDSGPTTPAQQGPDNLPATQGAPTIVQEPASSTIALSKEFDRFREELDDRNQPVSSEPVDSGDSGDERQDEKGQVRIPEDPWIGIPIAIPDGPEDNSEPRRKVSEIVTKPKPKPKPKAKTYNNLRTEVRATGHQPGSVVNESDVMAALRKVGRNPGSTLDQADIELLQKWYKDVHLARGN